MYTIPSKVFEKTSSHTTDLTTFNFASWGERASALAGEFDLTITNNIDDDLQYVWNFSDELF
jgi:hypothetical protein